LAGDPDAQYVVGSIYRRGDDAQPPVARDADQAQRYLSTAAAHGRVFAMAKMAELELAEDRPLDAMIWTQIYGYYRGWAGTANPGDYGEHNERQPTLYYEDLLRRVSERAKKKLGDQQTPLVVQQVNAFIAAACTTGVRYFAALDRAAGEVRERQRISSRKHSDRAAQHGFGVGARIHRRRLGEKSRTLRCAADFHRRQLASRTGDAIRNRQCRQRSAERFALKTVDLKKSDWPLGPTLTR
jgi:hypothetical protein